MRCFCPEMDSTSLRMFALAAMSYWECGNHYMHESQHGLIINRKRYYAAFTHHRWDHWGTSQSFNGTRPLWAIFIATFRNCYRCCKDLRRPLFGRNMPELNVTKCESNVCRTISRYPYYMRRVSDGGLGQVQRKRSSREQRVVNFLGEYTTSIE